MAPIADGFLGRLDPTLLANGPYDLILTAGDFGSNESSSSRPVNISGNLKLGNFTLGFTDLAIPVSGIPITITRTYDSLAAASQGDFGYGWQLSIAEANLEVDASSTLPATFGAYAAFTAGTHVTLTCDDATAPRGLEPRINHQPSLLTYPILHD